jgi:chemotaxis protein methyltransferase CheR
VTLTEADFEWVRGLVHRESAIVLDDGKSYLAESRLAALARRWGHDSVGDLVRVMRGGGLSELRPDVIDAMTTNETSFFRDLNPWEVLRSSILPELFDRRAEERTLSVWCAACSAGQEPYSLAMLLRDAFPHQVRDWSIRIVASDLSQAMLRQARQGRYSQLEVNRGVPASMLMRWFRKVGLEWQLVDDIRDMVDFRTVNLAERSTWRPLPRFDLVMMRNVLIYFDDVTRLGVLRRVHLQLERDGFLMLGAAESAANPLDCFTPERIDRTIVFSNGLPGRGVSSWT